MFDLFGAAEVKGLQHQDMALDKVLELTRLAVFVAFFLMSARLILAILFQAPPLVTILIAAGLFLCASAAFWNIRLTLFAFVSLLPLISGVQALGLLREFPLADAIFAAIYISWLGHRMLSGNRPSRPHNAAENLSDILSGIVLISLIATVVQYPFDFLWYRLFYYPFGDQREALHALDAAHTLLQGLFLFRMILVEVKPTDLLKAILPVFQIQTAIILVSSFMSIFFGVPKLHWITFGLKAPFSDIHCYGAYVSVLFFVSLSLFHASAGVKRASYGLLAALLLLFITFSGGNVTVLALMASCIIFIAVRARKYLLISLIVTACLVGSVLYVPSFFSESSNKGLKRYAKLADISNLPSDFGSVTARLVLWDRALSMIKELPLTGTGIGTYYALSTRYHDQDVSSWNRLKNSHENAHNYYLQMASELGIPALMIFLMIIWSCCKGVRPVLAGGSPAALVTGGLFFGLGVYLFSMLTSHHLLVGTQQLLFWPIMAAIQLLKEIPDGNAQ